MPTTVTRIALDHSTRSVDYEFTLTWNSQEVLFKVNTAGGIRVLNMDELSEENRAFFSGVLARSDTIENSPAYSAIVTSLQTELFNRRALVSASRDTHVTSRSTNNPFDRYYVSSSIKLPGILLRLVPAINVFMMLLSSMLLIPGVSTSGIGLFTAIAISSLGFMVQFFSEFLSLKLGDTPSRLIQDSFSALTLSISSFSSLSAISETFLKRAFDLGNVTDGQANFIGGILVIVLAALGVAVAWFSPPVSVMGPRVQAMAVQLEREFLKLDRRLIADSSTSPARGAASYKEVILKQFTEANNPFAYRFFCPGRIRVAEYQADARVIEPPGIITVGKRLGGAVVRSRQFALSLNLNQVIFESILIPLAGIGLIHSLVSRDLHLKVGSRTLRMQALSTYSPRAAKLLKWISELSSVSYSSLINPTIAYYFGFKILFDFFMGNSTFLSIRSLTLLASALAINALSSMINLSSRRLGIDSVEGWTSAQLRRIIKEAEEAAMRGNLEDYLQVIVMSAYHSIPLSAPAAPAPLRVGRRVLAAGMELAALGGSGGATAPSISGGAGARV